jgi:8-oxo-dGTP diphosphatase
MKKKYVVGFAFSHDYSRVVLIRKNKPKWQVGLLNGVGGKLEDGEDYIDAMEREFKEEAGVDVKRWFPISLMMLPDCDIMFFKAKLRMDQEKEIRSTTDEKIEIHNIVMLDGLNTIPNLQWLIPMALNDHDYYHIKQQ